MLHPGVSPTAPSANLLTCVSLLRSLSYVTCMGFMSFLLLGLMYFIIDIKGWWGGQPFIYPGMSINRRPVSFRIKCRTYTLSLGAMSPTTHADNSARLFA